MNLHYPKTREAIRTELLQEAARLWGYDDTDLALESFDPLVGLLLGSFATGLEQAYQELDNTQTRLIDQLVRLLMPEVFTGPTPAHAVMKTQIIDPALVINPTHFFTCQPLSKEFSFSPTGSFRLHNVQIKKALVQNRLRDYSGPVKEVTLTQSIGTHDYWLGLEVDPALDSFENLLLFIDWRNSPERSHYLTQVPDSRIRGKGFDPIVTIGLPDSADVPINTPAERQAHAINDEYNRHFISISSKPRETGQEPVFPRTKYPEELVQPLALADASTYFTTDLVWIQIAFPRSLPAEAVLAAYVDLNAFPVANQKTLTITPALRRFFNIFLIPTTNDDHFLDIVRVETPKGMALSPVQTLTRDEPCWYLVRRGEVTRFDERDGYQSVRTLTNLLRDENAMFSELKLSNLESDMSTLQQIVMSFHKALNDYAPNGLSATTYLTVRVPEEKGQLSITYRITQADLANRIPLGTPLKRDPANRSFTNEGAILLTTTTGGRKPLASEEQLPAFRKAIISRDRVVSNEDVRTFCFAMLGDKLRRVDLKKGVQLGYTQSGGLDRTLDVCLVPNPAYPLPADQWDDITHRLERELARHSNGLIRYQVLIISS